MKVSIILAVILMGISLSHADESIPAPVEEIGTIKEAVTVSKSIFIGLSESEVLKLAGISKLEPEGKDKNKKSYPGIHSTIPTLGGYIFTRHNLLTFREGKVVRHEVIDRISSCIITEPRDK